MQAGGENGWWRLDPGGRRLTLTLHIQPNAKRTEAVGLHGDALKIRLAAPPIGGAANEALVKYLAGVFGVQVHQVVLKRGAKSRQKVIEIGQPARGPHALFKSAADPGPFEIG